MTSPEGLLLAMLILPFLGSLTAAFLKPAARTPAWALTWAATLIALGIAAYLYPAVEGRAVLRNEIEWLPSLGLNFLLRLDGLSWIFSILVLGIGALVTLYARYYMSPEDPVPRFFAYLMAFMGSMLGLVLSGNLIQLAFFWELTSLFSFLLIGYWHHNQSARDAARMALIATAAGGLCLLLGVLLIGKIVGSYDLDRVLASGDLIQSSDLYLPALILILLGAFTKSAQFPFHFWLPHAMAAPTPVSAYLHSATMVKAGVFVLIRLWPVLAGTDAWYFIVSTTGLLTLLIGAWAAIFQQDLKGLLAYSTISHLGLITLLLGLGSPLAAVAAIFHAVNHATFKASLFMAAGIIDHETGTRDLRSLSGLYRFMPITATLAMVAAAAMAGVPLLNGFLSKEMFLSASLAEHSGTIIDQALPALATLASAFAVLYSLRFIHQTFFGPAPQGLPRIPGEAPHWMRVPIEILVVACLLVGILPAMTIGPYLATAVHSVLGDATPAYSLAVWHGFNPPLFMSIAALGLGTGAYLLFRKTLNRQDGAPLIRRLKGRKIFEASLAAIVDTARALERLLGTRRLQPQLRLLVVVALLAGLLPFTRLGYGLGDHQGTVVDPGFAVVWMIGGACAIGAAWLAKYHRLAALILTGGAGLVCCITFLWLSAPDLALTQLLVETVTTVLLLLGLRWLPIRAEEVWPGGRAASVTLRRAIDLTIAVAAGLGMTLIAYAVMTRPLPGSVSRFFVERAYPEGGGTNVVNVILVDFRAFDTLGEVTVLAIVALTVFALLRRFRPAQESVGAPAQQRVQNAIDEAREGRQVGDTLKDYLLIPRVIMEWLFPVIMVFAIYLWIRGHDMPGGGFAAGITLSIALIVLYMASGTRRVEARLRVQPARWIGFGLLLALLTGMGAWLFGHPFLTSYFGYLDLPIVGKVPAASALLFDLGVFLIVVGATALILIAIAHQSIRRPSASILRQQALEQGEG
ncbi:monovalent cation/H+ antiporter subunit A [Allosphingosinicella vermicomposti]|uniref:monovalent cation/H+ antiporter subunit A n=1 Tax=Allosphingosinicella vermicomposti TaxID=614671 RepID=UPI000D108412|nr:monovalent cation/H+ antiporter subunit A [Allosphingosinicella vermicomposti]